MKRPHIEPEGKEIIIIQDSPISKRTRNKTAHSPSGKGKNRANPVVIDDESSSTFVAVSSSVVSSNPSFALKSDCGASKSIDSKTSIASKSKDASEATISTCIAVKNTSIASKLINDESKDASDSTLKSKSASIASKSTKDESKKVSSQASKSKHTSKLTRKGKASFGFLQSPRKPSQLDADTSGAQGFAFRSSRGDKRGFGFDQTAASKGSSAKSTRKVPAPFGLFQPPLEPTQPDANTFKAHGFAFGSSKGDARGFGFGNPAVPANARYGFGTGARLAGITLLIFRECIKR